MSDFWSSALNYFGGGSDSNGGSRFIGQTVDLGEGNKLRVKKVIAEGGYGYVFIAQDTKTGKDYALKRQVVATENVKLIKQEIAFLKQLADHPHIIQFVAAAGCPPTMTSHGSAEFLIQTELCSGGRMEDVVVSMQLTPRQVLRVFYETCSAVAHMHSQDPPIIHRDLKIENLLLSTKGAIKLCDFGSATTERLSPDRSWTAVQRGLTEDEIQRNTTPMYRAPEMIDLYSNSPINESADVWALGCLLYKLCYQEHPFEDSAKLRILNANYRMPANDNTYTAFQGIIRSCLVVDPTQRPSVDSIIAQLYILADQLGESLDQPPTEPLVGPAAASAADASEGSSGVQAALQSTHRFFGFMKDGAESLFKNIKEGSSKIVESMSGHSSALSSKHPHLDITYITSRIIAMSFPHKDSSHPNSIEEVRDFLDSRHPAQYLVFNLSGHSYDTAKLNNQVADMEWPERCVPNLEKVVDLCRNLDSWLRADQQNIVVIHCHDGQSITSVVVAAYLLFLGGFRSPAVPLKLFSSKRVPDAPPIIGSGSEQRYLQHIVDLVGPRAYKPHTHSASLQMLRMTTIPLFNAIRTGCKPFVEVYQNGERVYTSASQDSMDQIRSFSTSEETSVEVPLEATVRGNVMVIVHHIRAIPIARKAGVGMTAVRMLQFQLHTGFISPDATSVTLERRELDGPAARKPGKFPSPFQVILDLQFHESDAPISPGALASWQNLPHPRASPLTCFSSHTEEQEVLRQYADMDRRLAVDWKKKAHDVPRAQPSPSMPPPSMDEESTSAGGNLLAGRERKGNGQPFFSQLNWQADAGYMAFRDQDEGESSSDSEGEFREEGQAKPDPFKSTESRRGGEGKSNGGAFANFEDAFTGKKEEETQRPSKKTAEPKLIELSFSESDQQQASSMTQPAWPQSQPQPPAQTQPHTSTTTTTPVFKLSGDFDPWKGLDTDEGNLLGLEDSDEFNSQVSECRTAGAETFKPKTKQSSPKKTSVDSQRDPFGSTADSSGDKLFELLAKAPIHPAPSTSSLPGVGSESKPPDSVLSPNLLDPFHPSHRSYSTSQLPQARTESAPNYAPSGYPSQMGGSGRNSPYYSHSPYNTSPRASPVPFGSSGNLAQTGSRSGSSSSLNAQSQPQPPPPTQAAKADPFADFGNVKQMASGKLPPTTTTTSATSAKSAFQPMTSRPAYMYGSGTGTGNPKQPPYTHKQGSQPPRPHSPNPLGFTIGNRDERGTRPKTGVGPKLSEDMFSDILHNQGFSTPKEKGPTTLKGLKQLTDIDKAVDPERARVAAWAEGKERNIRALLGSLQTILWEGEERWKEVGMHQLLQPDQVKKSYRKACLSVHPDKCQGMPHEKLARAIFDELNDAYKKFEDNPSPALF